MCMQKEYFSNTKGSIVMNDEFENTSFSDVPSSEPIPTASEPAPAQDIPAENALPSDETVFEPLNAEPAAAYNEESPVLPEQPVYTAPASSPSPAASRKASRKKRRNPSSKGFKVFAAAVFSVFTVSVAAIAVVLVMNHLDDAKAASASDAQTDATAVSAPSAPTKSVSTSSAFAKVPTALTKSQVAAKCSPSAVGIVVEVPYSAPTGYYDFFGGFFGNYGYGYEQPPQYSQGAGSGFIYSADGTIITNHHVIEDAAKITVYLNDRTTVEAELIGSDELSDIAVIKIDPTGLDLVPMEIGNSDTLVVGDEVIAIGCPAGIDYMGTVTDGIISAINRDVQLSDSKKTMTLLQTNATINRGNSGGPLIDASGKVIGINTLKLGADYEGIGFSIPINGALPIIAQILEYGEVVDRDNSFVSGEASIGIRCSDISSSDADYYGIPLGVLVVQIDKDSSAAKAGLRRGDIITAYNGKTVTTTVEINTCKSANKAGDEITLTVYRDGGDDSDGTTVDITFKLDTAK